MATKDKLKAAADATKTAASDAADKVKAEAEARVAEGKATISDEFGDTAAALRSASEKMRSGSPQERVIGQIANTLADVSDQVRDRDLKETLDVATSFARRNPLTFLGSAALLGFAAARFAKASEPQRQVTASNVNHTSGSSHE